MTAFLVGVAVGLAAVVAVLVFVLKVPLTTIFPFLAGKP